MRITVDLDRKDGIPRIKSKWYANSGDDVRMINLGIDLYQQWTEKLNSLAGTMNGKDVIIENKGEQS